MQILQELGFTGPQAPTEFGEVMHMYRSVPKNRLSAFDANGQYWFIALISGRLSKYKMGSRQHTAQCKLLVAKAEELEAKLASAGFTVGLR